MGLPFEAFTPGRTWRTPGRTVTTTDLVGFAGLSGDYNPVHTDEAFARATEFGSCIAHGPMGIGWAFGLAARLDLIDGTVVALLGVQWAFKAPMRPGDTIHAVIRVTEARPVRNPEHGLVVWDVSLVNQADTVAQQGTATLLIRRTVPDAAQWGEITQPG